MSPVGERTANGTTQATYVYGRGLDEPVSMRRDVKGANGVFSPDGTPENYYYLLDDQDNAWFLADHQGNVVEAYAYGGLLDEYVHVEGSASGEFVRFPNDFGYPAFLDADTGVPRRINMNPEGGPATFANPTGGARTSWPGRPTATRGCSTGARGTRSWGYTTTAIVTWTPSRAASPPPTPSASGAIR